MKLKLTKNGTISQARRIVTPAGIFTGEEFYNFAEGKGDVFETTLDKIGYDKIKNLQEDAPEKFHVNYQGFGWIEVTL